MKRMPRSTLVFLLALLGMNLWLVTRGSSHNPDRNERALSQLLADYAGSNGGRLPRSLNQLIQTGDLWCTNKGQLQVRKVSAMLVLKDLTLDVSDLEVAWGATADQVNASGYVPAMGKFLISSGGSADESPYGNSARLARTMKTAAAASQPASCPS